MGDSATPPSENRSGTGVPPSSSSTSSSLLNIPSNMSRSALTLETPSSSSSSSSSKSRIDRLVGAGYHPSPSKTIYSDRFIPSRSASNFALFDISPSSNSSSEGREDGSGTYATLLKTVLFGPDSGVVSPITPEKQAGFKGRHSPLTPPNRNIFRYKTETRLSLYSLSPFGFDDTLPGVIPSPAKTPRKVPRSPYKVLDAPALQDDFYLNLVDWSSHNMLAVGLGNCVYLWNACSSKVTKLCDLGMDDSVCSVGWAQRGTHLAIGTNNGKLQIWDASRCRRVRTMEGHRLRVGALAWSSSLLSSGSRDKTILQRDIRAQDDFVSKLTGHRSEVCGLKWSYDNRELASGGNDNRLFVWNQHSAQPVLKYCEHTAAVKAIAWSPHLHGLLASGGGTADRCIRFWNTTTNSHLSCMDTGSQVCNLVWSKNVNELVSTHGYSQNQIIVWRYPTMSKLATLTGHTYRVLYLAISPDGQTIVTGAGDETLRFWNVFPSPKSKNSDSEIGASSLGRTQIR
ncbi:hypothetical protein NE237_012966 [Protea cynaroides]|uniref:CDC20/Fizzy WD40 domain-containing protein n=1 Tax=Protea cynaroides TaxID=273540 RepID=A0A9Q0H0T8_9MAGN|nr:hypothetical protein NE237_012966 [Protea cynaroides]